MANFVILSILREGSARCDLPQEDAYSMLLRSASTVPSHYIQHDRFVIIANLFLRCDLVCKNPNPDGFGAIAAR